jgi:hypothetical protein
MNQVFVTQLYRLPCSLTAGLTLLVTKEINIIKEGIVKYSGTQHFIYNTVKYKVYMILET